MPIIVKKPPALASLRHNTPVEEYVLQGKTIFVKREDLAWPFPPLSKARGVWSAMESRPEAKGFAVVDTNRSLNGQLVATIGMTQKRPVVCGYPRYKHKPADYMPGPTLSLKSLGVELVPIAANRQFVMRAAMGQWVKENKGEGWYVFPTGLRLPESVEAIEREATLTLNKLPEPPRSIIVPSGTGTHLAGLIRAFWATDALFVATLGYERDEPKFKRDVIRAAKIALDPERLWVVRTDAGYYDVRPGKMPPFPAHLHYECRAWNWLSTAGALEQLAEPILFWNIGA